ncbi:hypothetical protein PR001_g24184 [Phytophthora rubi]|uniref:Uncharacterized protein n=1 Tax=Phytophthora rubi TaxID=129364 RepID=A0A6A3IL38_9STRA|nr:hypothetical protein PR001_g24184 [Phytophthora rubi]
MKMAQHGFGPVEKLLRDSVDPLTKPISELENYSSQMFEGLVLIGTFCIEGHRLWAFIGKLANKYRDVPYPDTKASKLITASVWLWLRARLFGAPVTGRD